MKRLPLVLAALLLGACDDDAPQPSAEAHPISPSGACAERSFEGSRFTVCTADTRTHDIQLRLNGRNGTPLRSLEALHASLGADLPRVVFAMNGGMYDDAGRPIGLYVDKGKTRKKLNLRDGPGNFHLKPNGVFAIDDRGRASVTPAADFAEAVPKPRWATQSGPMLVVRGKLHPKIAADGESRFVRNGVGVRDARTAYFVISEDAVSFGRFARFFRDALHCRDALFLDGSVSSLWDPATSRVDAYSRLGPMILVLKREPAR